MADKYAAVGYRELPSKERGKDHFGVARLLQDRLEAFIAGNGGDDAKLQTILDVAKIELANSANNREANSSSALSTKRLRRVAGVHKCKQIVCGHSCSEHEELMRPSLWGSLPKDLLPPIFARLPLSAIARLRSVSKAWLESISSIDSDFSRELEAASQSMVALISPIHELPGRFQIRIYDFHANEWHCYDMQPMLSASTTLGAADGGLLCFVSIELNDPFSIVVVNPFTMTTKKLPYLQNLHVQPTMVNLSVDAQTGEYKVVVAGFTNQGGQEFTMEVYDSETDQWAKADSSKRIYGYAFQWEVNQVDNQFEEVLLGPCVCAKGKIESVLDPHMNTCSIQSYVLVKNHLFVLHKVVQKVEFTSSTHIDVLVYNISEFEYKNIAWVKVADHKCNPFQLCPKQEYHLSLHAACGFLMVFADIGDGIPFYHDSGWLYHLPTKTWYELPPLPVEYNFHTHSCDLLCEIKLSVDP